jgi:hypothetical protein
MVYPIENMRFMMTKTVFVCVLYYLVALARIAGIVVAVAFLDSLRKLSVLIEDKLNGQSAVARLADDS